MCVCATYMIILMSRWPDLACTTARITKSLSASAASSLPPRVDAVVRARFELGCWDPWGEDEWLSAMLLVHLQSSLAVPAQGLTSQSYYSVDL